MATVIVLWGILTGLLAFAHQYWMVVCIMLVNGLVYSPYEPLYKTIIQQIVPIRMQAKVSSAIRPITGLDSLLGAGFLVSGVATVVVLDYDTIGQ